MRMAICDDDAAVLSSLTDFINKTYHDIDVLTDRYSSGEALIRAIEKRGLSYDLLFLDIEMGGMDGMQVAKRAHALLPDMSIVFITSHDEFATAGYEVSAFRFLTKPIQPAKLMEAIAAVKKALLSQKTIHIQSKATEAVLKVTDILYIEAQDKHVKIVSRDQLYDDRKGIAFYTQLLAPNDFYRIHRGYLINLRYVKFIDGLDILMANGDVLPMSRLRKKQFVEAFHTYIKRTAR
ncbi:MAG: LytTR family DNA-binding domain-containing protein [Peptococcaceae bacterium]|nr:LytTR family DNA-binding domain-containing protein [Peptococcaceae bacterium]